MFSFLDNPMHETLAKLVKNDEYTKTNCKRWASKNGQGQQKVQGRNWIFKTIELGSNLKFF